MPVWQQLILAIVGSGSTTALITAFAARRKNAAEANATNVTSILEVDERLAKRLADMEERIAVLERENFQLRNEVLSLTYENKTVLQENRRLREENIALKEENELLREANFELMEQLENI